MKRVILFALLAGCAQAQAVDTDDGSMTLSAGERAIIARTIEEQAAAIDALRKAVQRLTNATGCT